MGKFVCEERALWPLGDEKEEPITPVVGCGEITGAVWIPALSDSAATTRGICAALCYAKCAGEIFLSTIMANNVTDCFQLII